MSGPGKFAWLLSPLGSRPQEFRDRVAMLLDVQLESLRNRRGGSTADDTNGALARLDALSPRPLSTFLLERELARFTDEMREEMADLHPETAISPAHNADLSLARFCCAVCRGLEPAAVVETGVAYGVTSAFLLKALSVNGRVLLYSVDVLVHDSLHTRRNMRRELDLVTPRLARPSMVVADDVDGNEAFASWCADASPALQGVLAEEDKDASFGFALLV